MTESEGRRHKVRVGGEVVREPVPIRSILRVASVASGIQFGWALQLSLLTPYVQELGIPHAWSSVIWLCGPLSGLFVQPLAGLMSDRCKSRFGRRRPFIVAGAAGIILSVFVIGYSADIGWYFGDREGTKTYAIVVFVIGFWILDMANNLTQGPSRALLADLSGKDQERTRVANAYFSLFMAVGNVLGYATGAYGGWFKIFPFTLTTACNINCANLKAAFLLDIAFIMITTYISISASKEQTLDSNRGLGHVKPTDSHEPFLWKLFGSFRYLSRPVWLILIITSLTWIGWFPFLLFDTDWIVREIYHGKPNEGQQKYNDGVKIGAFGLMLNSVVLGIASLFIEKLCRKYGAGFIWGGSNMIMFLCLLSMPIISFVARNVEYNHGLPPSGVVIGALIVFSVLGIPLAVTFSVPYALVSSGVENLGLGQGLSMGVLNVFIVIPQVVVSLGSGPLDQLFGGGNSPAFAVAAVSAFASGLLAIYGIPRSWPEKSRVHV